ncbi:MAG TPA: flagellar export chaperone FliS [Bryobacteraceae bacterium]|nr:flagellar export chaperone FliS [Bryobacteraceae bacterium]
MTGQAYLEAQVLAADPMELVCLLYQLAIDQVREARRYLASGAIPERCKAITKAIAAVGELNNSLDHQAGGAISTNLEQLYCYMTLRLTEANLRRDDKRLAEVESLLETLASAWKETRARQAASSGPAPVAVEAWQEAGETADAHAWSA